MGFLSSFHQYSDWGVLLLRLAIAVIFLVHGFPKITGAKQMTAAMGKPQMAGFFTFLGIAEVLGAIGMTLGLLTQPAALGLAIVMISAIGLKTGTMKAPFTSHQGPSWEFDFILLAANISLILTGGGAYALDRVIFGI